MARPSATLVLLVRAFGDAADMTTTPLLDPREDRSVTSIVTRGYSSKPAIVSKQTRSVQTTQNPHGDWVFGPVRGA
jgi:hypothetical protein